MASNLLILLLLTAYGGPALAQRILGSRGHTRALGLLRQPVQLVPNVFASLDPSDAAASACSPDAALAASFGTFRLPRNLDSYSLTLDVRCTTALKPSGSPAELLNAPGVRVQLLNQGAHVQACCMCHSHVKPGCALNSPRRPAHAQNRVSKWPAGVHSVSARLRHPAADEL
jgi:hypothetical protein